MKHFKKLRQGDIAKTYEGFYHRVHDHGTLEKLRIQYPSQVDPGNYTEWAKLHNQNVGKIQIVIIQEYPSRNNPSGLVSYVYDYGGAIVQ